MTTPSVDPICVRNSHLQHIMVGRRNLFDEEKAVCQLTKDGLIDALLVLYDDCNSNANKKDSPTVNFVEKFQPVVTKLKKLRVNIADFEMKKLIGRGHFGEVHLVKEKQTGNVYAMKVMKKEVTIAKQDLAFYEEEKDIMAKATSEWITSLHCSFQDNESLYLVMEFHPGGDMLSLLNRIDGQTLSEEDARFYLAEMILALNTLHTMGYVHRDVKPENILLDRLGHIKLADFGSAAKLDSSGLVRNAMAIGTQDYIAPEILTSLNNVGLLAGGYGTTCDYWSLGVMAYEMVYGSTPFRHEKKSVTIGNIMNFKKSLEFPSSKKVTPEFTSLIKGLLCDSDSRLGYQELIKHPFFSTIDWNGIRETSPPVVPVISSLDDTSNFDEFDSESSLHAPSTVNFKSAHETKERNLPFIGFTYVKEGTSQVGSTESSLEQQRRVIELEEELKTKNKEISDLRRQKIEYEQKGKQWNIDLLNQKIHRLQLERDGLEKKLLNAQRDADQQRRALEMEKSERKKSEEKVVQMVKDLKENWRKIADKEVGEKQAEIQVWKQVCDEKKEKVEEFQELLKTAIKSIDTLEKDCEGWKAKAEKYKDIAARGHRVAEKRASVCFAPINDALIQTQQQLEQEKLLTQKLKDKNHELQDQIRKLIATHEENLTSAETRWNNEFSKKEEEYHQTLDNLEEKIIRQKENKIKELESRLQEQLNECIIFKERSDQLQKSLDESLVWKSCFETSFSKREGELEMRVRTLEEDLKSITHTKLELQQQLTELSLREAATIQKCEGITINMKEAVEKLERKNRELEREKQMLNEQLSSLESFSSSTLTNHPESEELKQKITFQEEQIGKLDEQLQRAREGLTLEREKSRQLELDLWKKEKELSGVKIDVRIANRETKTAENEVNKLKEEANLFEAKLKSKDAEVDGIKADLAKAKNELADAQRLLSEKERAQADNEKKCEEAKKALESAREQRRECQRLKDELSICQRQKTSLESEVLRTEERMNRYAEEKKELMKSMEEQKAKLQESEKNLVLLKETMSEMDEQLEAFGNFSDDVDKKQLAFESQKTTLNQEIEKLKQEVRTAKQQINEEKSLKLFTESKLRDVESRLKSCETDSDSRIHSLEKETSELNALVSKLNEQVAEMDQQLADSELSINSMSRKISFLEEDNVKLQEESSALRTQLISVKNSNAVLSEGLEEAILKGEKYKTQIVQLETQIETTRVLFKEREVKLESTVGQQTKLIDFLQTKAEQNKKKPTLTDKLFGSSKKENHSTIPLNYRDLETKLEKKNAECRSLSDQVNKYKAELAASKSESSSASKVLSNRELNKGAAMTEQARCQSATPLPHRDLNRITQSPGTQSSPSFNSGYASQRMHHNIPHRLQSQMVMRPTNCAVCLDSIHFGRQVSVCQDCGASAHVKCASHLPRTCGLPVGLAEHFGTVIGQETPVAGKRGESTNPSTSQMKGFVKIPRLGKATCWERKYMKLNGTRLCIFDHEPNLENMEPIDSFELRPTDGSTVAIHSAVAQSDVFASAKTDVPYIFMVESIPLTTCWPGRTLFVMALTFPDKKAWVSALENITQEASQNRSAALIHRKPKPVLKLNNPIDVNCFVKINEGVFLIGAKEGLFSHRLQSTRDLVKIEGVDNVHQIVLVPKLSSVLMIVGEERQLVITELPVVQGCADVIQCAKPSLEVDVVPNCEDCHLFEVSNLDRDEIFLCAATQDRVKLFKWNCHASAFILRKELIVSETCSCILFTEHSVLVGCDRFYEVDLGNFSAEEFLDASDSTLAHIVFGLKQNHSFPVSILEVTAKKGETEFLLCYHEFGIFVDGYGRRSRSEDFKWTRLSLGFAYRSPYLFVLHFNSVEVIRLTSTSFRSARLNESGSSEESAAACPPPPGVFIEMPSPRYLGPAAEPGASYFLTKDENDVMTVVQVVAPVVLGEKDRPSQVHLDDISLSGSEFSITPSMAKILDQTDDSASVYTLDPSTSPFKRQPSSREPVASSSKRVKFESDL